MRTNIIHVLLTIATLGLYRRNKDRLTVDNHAISAPCGGIYDVPGINHTPARYGIPFQAYRRVNMRRAWKQRRRLGSGKTK